MPGKESITTDFEVLRLATPIEGTDELVFSEVATEMHITAKALRKLRRTYEVRSNREKPGQTIPTGLRQDVPGYTTWILKPKPLRRCNMCGKTSPPLLLEMFVPDLKYRHGRKNLCRACNKELFHSYLKTNPEYRQRQIDKLKQWIIKHGAEFEARRKAKRLRRRLIKIYGETWQFCEEAGFPNPVLDPIAEEARTWLYVRPGLSLEEVTAKEHGDKEFAELIMSHSGQPITQGEIDNRADELIARCPLPPISSPLPPLDIPTKPAIL